MNTTERARLVPAQSGEDVRQEFRDYRPEITEHRAEIGDDQVQRQSRQTEGNGTAEGVLTSKPRANDEFGAVAYGRAPDERSDRGLMTAVGIAALTQREQENEDEAKRQQAQQATPDARNEPQPAQGRRIEDMQPSRPDYRTLENGETQAQQDRAALTGPQPSSERQARPEDEQRRADMAALVNPEAHAEVQREQVQAMQRQRTYSQSLSL